MMLLVAYVFSYCCYLELAMRRAISSTTQRKFKAKTSFLQVCAELFSHPLFSFLIIRAPPCAPQQHSDPNTLKCQLTFAISSLPTQANLAFARRALQFSSFSKSLWGSERNGKAQKRIAESTEIYNKYVTNMYTGTKVAIPYKLMHFDAEI